MALATSFSDRVSSEPKKVFEEIYDHLHDPERFPVLENPQYQAFYDEILTRCVADVAGMLQTGDARNPDASKFQGTSRLKHAYTGEQPFDSRSGAELGAMFKVLASQHGEDEARNLILGNLAGFTKGMVHTPHPTELMNEAAIEAQERLMGAVIDYVKEITRTGTNPQSVKVAELDDQIRNALIDVGKTITQPVSESLTIDQEMRRSIRFSQRQFDSIPGIVNTVLQATKTSSAQLSTKQLEQFSHLIEPQTWSPGDQDSKPDMTAEKLQQGVNLSSRSMMFHYYRTLAVIGAEAEKNGVPKEQLDRVEDMMHRLLKTGCDAYDTPQTPTPKIAEEKIKGISNNGMGETGNFSSRFEKYANTPFAQHFLTDAGFEAKQQNAVSYKNADEFLKDLESLRALKLPDPKMNEERRPEITGVRQDKYDSLTSLDSLIIQTMNFRDTALKVQVRQNAERHSEVTQHILSMLPQDNEVVRDVTAKLAVPKRNRENDSSAFKTLLDAFATNKAGFRDLLQEKLEGGDAEHLGLKQVKATLDEFAKQKFPDEKAKSAGLHKLIDEKIGQENYNTYQVMETLGLAASHPAAVQRYLIAECRSESDLLEAFFLLKVMESLRAPDEKGKVEIVNLVEHPDLVKGGVNDMRAPVMTVGAMANDQFREHHLGIDRANHLLQDYSLKYGHGPLTVANAKNTYGIPMTKEQEEIDSHRFVKGVKMMMGAGSDITKQGSAAAAAGMMDAMAKTREALLNDKDNPILLIDYIGVGGGVHRSQPVSSSTETVQGQSMRQSPENIAQKVLGLTTAFLHRKLALNPVSERGVQDNQYLGKSLSTADRQLLARVNMSNLANLPSNEAIWQKETKGRTYAMMGAYEELYKSPEFTGLMSYSANMYADLTKFAARPSERELKPGEKPKPKGYLAPVDVDGTRAIGFGAALNAAGMPAPLFFGGSKYLANEAEDRCIRNEAIHRPADPLDKQKAKEVKAALTEMYLWDPKAQDTINRMTYGIVMADMDVAWKYQGFKEPPREEQLREFASLPQVVYKDKDNPTRAELQVQARKALAEITLEYNDVAGKLLRLHLSVAGQRMPAEKLETLSRLTGKEAADALLTTLPAPLREQLTLSRRHIEKPRNDLADLFRNMGVDPSDPDYVDPRTVKKGSGIYNQTIYPAMGAIFECFEHTPRAYTRPKWVKAVEPQQQMAVA